VQFVTVLLLTPAYTAGALAEEKERRTLEFLLATDLHNREIVLSKLASRVAQLTLLVFTGLPILGFTQLLGGIDPNLVLAGFIATGLTMASLASFSILCSTYTRKVRDAVVLTYLGLAAYLGLSHLVASEPAITAAFGDRVLAGNVFAVLTRLQADVAADKDLAGTVPGLLRDYAIYHGSVALICVAWAVARLRVVALRHVHEKAPRQARSVRHRLRPRVRSLPMVWKEVFAEPGFRLNWPGKILVGLLMATSLAPALVILLHWMVTPAPLYGYGQPYGSPAGLLEELSRPMNIWVRLVGTGVACLVLLGVAVRAAGSISGERDRETLDSLLLSPLHSYDILFAKWLGSLVGMRWAFAWLSMVWGLALVTGGLHLGSLVLLMLTCLVYASTLAGIGLWFSTACRTTLRATLATLGVAAGVSGGPWLLWLCCLPVGIPAFDIAGFLSPPAVLGWLAASWSQFGTTSDWDVRAILCLFGLFFWALAAAFLWSVTMSRFRRISSRMPYRRPEQAIVYRRSVLSDSTSWR
jgi:ABC-type transport system involved in multi-copper enzyme maturation permease subunit